MASIVKYLTGLFFVRRAATPSPQDCKESRLKQLLLGLYARRLSSNHDVGPVAESFATDRFVFV
jgi:hypothetical protein